MHIEIKNANIKYCENSSSSVRFQLIYTLTDLTGKNNLTN